MPATLTIGADIGTTNVKAIAYEPHSDQIIAHASRPLHTLQPQPGYSEQDPEAIWQAFGDVMRELMQAVQQAGATVGVVAFSAAMHSLIAIDAQGNPITNALLWSDNRAEAEARTLRTHQAALGQAIYEQTGTPIHPMIPLCKLAYWRHHQPDLIRDAARFISIKEFLWVRLTGEYDIDFSMATATGLFDQEHRQWSPLALSVAGIADTQLSVPVPTMHIRPLLGSAATHTGLEPGTPLLIGASDGCLANLGAGAVAPGMTTLTIGTSGAIRQTVRQPLRDPQGRLFCYHLTEGYYVVGGPTNNGANVLQWLAEQFTRQTPEAVLAQAAQINAGADGLLFLPYLQGERAPLWDAAVRGAFHHVDWLHTQAHFVRATLEGVLFNLWSINQLLGDHTDPTHVIHANGGFAQSAFWVQMLADIAGVPVRLNASNESGAVGAILLALTATGHYPTLDVASGSVSFGKTYEPNPEHHRVYRETFERFRALQADLANN
ncbi:gluconokinase [Rudanella lutea]|uniref:gluconokinase n=1 Tax=Rudanella lutea TaxID=451374 RepID=UPI00035C1E6A|nr:gluconokinase [Rudanella lutea]